MEPTGRFTSFDGTQIAFWESGRDASGGAVPVVLVHGYASSTAHNWIAPGVFEALATSGLRVTALDVRGHGRSDKPHELRAYENDAMARDVTCLVDHLGLEAPALVGYSMGSTLVVRANALRGQAARLVIGGHGDTLVVDWEEGEHVARGLVADGDEGLDEVQIGYRRFVADAGGDPIALARVAQASRRTPPDMIRAIDVPTLILTGVHDVMVGPVDGLAAQIAHAKVVRSPGGHLTAPGAPEFAEALIGFLQEGSRS